MDSSSTIDRAFCVGLTLLRVFTILAAVIVRIDRRKIFKAKGANDRYVRLRVQNVDRRVQAESKHRPPFFALEATGLLPNVRCYIITDGS